ncbi:MAG: hypothetical protein EOO40_00120 [Deltaproteobacteria bacterium]|nr:MAG: hypothetical protein EOO40_00120 [Deltaproteobacteria bacterium]
MTPTMVQSLMTLDPEVAALIGLEAQRQSDRLELVASENHISLAQREASGSVLADTTVEGYPGARFLSASAGVDALERLAIDRACQLFGARFANVQPHSGTQANQAAATRVGCCTSPAHRRGATAATGAVAKCTSSPFSWAK